MAGYGPEQKRQGCDNSPNEGRYPYGSSQEKFSHIGLLYGECSEWGGFGLAEEDKNRIEFVLVRNKEKDGKCEWNEEL